jgi:hypothetical protein
LLWDEVATIMVVRSLSVGYTRACRRYSRLSRDISGAASRAVTRRRGRYASPIYLLVYPFAVVAVVAATVTAGAAQTPPCADCTTERALPSADIVPDSPAKPPVPLNDPAVQARLPGCAVWTDRCVTCQREAGKISCSNIGIACQPQAVECLRSESAEEKKQEN